MKNALALLVMAPLAAFAWPPAEYTWQQGLQPSFMESEANSICYLTGVSGKFRGAGESVKIERLNGYYYLNGSSHQEGIQAWAMCIENQESGTLGADYTWNQMMQLPIIMKDSRSNTCYLTGLSGKFMGGGEMVEITNSGNLWILSGISSQTGVSANANCISSKDSNLHVTFEWSQGQAPVTMTNTQTSICVLQKVRGAFSGGAESVRITQQNGKYVLSGSSNQHGVSAKALCISRNG